MSSSTSTLVLDLRSTVPHLTGPAGERQLVDAVAWTPEAGLVLGEPALRVLAADPGSGWLHLLPRVGDPSPCRLGPDAVDAATLVARLVASAPVGEADELRVACPAGWTGQQRRALAGALTASGLPAPRLLDAVTVALGPGQEGVSVQVCLLEATHLGVRAVSGTATGWITVASADVPFGTEDIDDALVGFVAGRLGADLPTDIGGRAALRAACADARVRLAAAPAVDVAAPGLPAVRVLRSDLDDLVGRRLEDALAVLPQSIARPEREPQRAVLAGAGAGLPTLVQALSARLGRPVAVAASEPSAAELAGPAFAAPATGTDAPPREPGDAEAAPRPARALVATPAPAPRPRRRPRYALAAAACLVAVGGPAAALTDPGLRAGLLSLMSPAPAATAAAAPILAPGGLVLSDDLGPGEASGSPGTSGPAASNASRPTPAGGSAEATVADLLEPMGSLGSAGLDSPTAAPETSPATTPAATTTPRPTAAPGTTTAPTSTAPAPGPTTTQPGTGSTTMPSSTMPTAVPPPSSLTPTQPPATTVDPPTSPPTTDPTTTDPTTTDPTTDPPTSDPPSDPPTTDPPTSDPPSDPPAATGEPTPTATDEPTTSAPSDPATSVTTEP